MSVSIRQSFVEQFSFNGKNVRAVYIQDVGECLVACDVYKAIGYSRKAGVQAIQRLVPDKYRMRLRGVDAVLQGVLKFEYPQADTVLLKEPGLYCFLLRCKKVDAEPFMDWVVETVLPKEVRKLSQKLEEHHRRTTQLQQAITYRDNRIQAIKYENVGLQAEIRAKDQQIEASQERIEDLIANRHVPRSGAINTVLVVVEKNADKDTKRILTSTC